jgi:hypothetical protein
MNDNNHHTYFTKDIGFDNDICIPELTNLNTI